MESRLGTGTVSIPNCANVISTLTVHVHGVVTNWSYALAEFLVSLSFHAFPGNPSNVTHCKCFFSSIPFLFSVQKCGNSD